MDAHNAMTVDGFEAHTLDGILRILDNAEPNWRWTAPSSCQAGKCSLKFGRKNLHTSSITSAEHSVGLQAVARRNSGLISIYFMLEGGLEVGDRRSRRLSFIPAGHVASTGNSAKRLSIEPGSAWLAFHIPETVLRQRFESLTGSPYLREFELPPTNFSQGDAQRLYQALRMAEQDLDFTSAGERPMLERAHQQLVLAKLFAKMPHNLADDVVQRTPADAPTQLLNAEAFMRNNLTNPITIDDLANAAGCSPRALQRMFRSYRGDSPIGTLCHYRLAAAHSVIKTGRAESITELALSLQFSNPSRFSVLYKIAYGVSPSSNLRFARGIGKDDHH
ncbi:helix-turn-helix transcriptional regulator [Ensifer sp. ENS05]|uniref:helix-turn-helix transcriptional regulator n=1 Tax=Ensifer sp. ENS05 TaxID=2769277 RepID=UPI001FEEE4BC|nr:helix-turn-helix transcriptional regulator [Ensifer sp. ENS05]